MDANRIKLFLGSLICLFILFVGSTVVAEQWYDPMEVSPDLTPEKIEMVKLYNQELSEARRDYEARDFYSTIEHIQKAISYRPEHPDNIKLEYKMGVIYAQRENREKGQFPKRNDALKTFVEITEKYKHLDYYSNDPMESDSIENNQMMVPRAAIHAASLTIGLERDHSQARAYAEKALDCINETFQKRKADWLSAPAPQEPTEITLQIMPRLERVWKGKLNSWNERKEKALQGEVLGQFETKYAEAAVRQYGYSFGEKQNLGDVMQAMAEIMQKYPDTPMAKIANENIMRAKDHALKISDDVFFDDINQLSNAPEIEMEKVAWKDIFVPKKPVAQKDGKPFIFSFSKEKLISISEAIETRSAYESLTKLGHGDIAWDDKLIALRDSLIFSERDEKDFSQKVDGEWSDSYLLPNDFNLPYSFIIKTKENVSFLVFINNKNDSGIWIRFRELKEAEFGRYIKGANL